MRKPKKVPMCPTHKKQLCYVYIKNLHTNKYTYLQIKYCDECELFYKVDFDIKKVGVN